MNKDRVVRRVMGMAVVSALCVGATYAADAPKSDPAAKKPVAASKSTAPAPAKASKPTPKASNAKQDACAPVACKTSPTNYVEPVCAPAPAQADAQKFNTFEDIYSPPSASTTAALATSTTGSPSSAEPATAPPPPPSKGE